MRYTTKLTSMVIWLLIGSTAFTLVFRGEAGRDHGSGGGGSDPESSRATQPACSAASTPPNTPAVDPIRAEWPGIPEDYLAWLRQRGHGVLGRHELMIYSAPVRSTELHDAATAAARQRSEALVQGQSRILPGFARGLNACLDRPPG